MSEGKYLFSVERTAADFSDLLQVMSPKIWGRWRIIVNYGLLLFLAIVVGIAVGVLFSSLALDSGGVFSNNVPLPISLSALTAGILTAVLPLVNNSALKPKFFFREGAFQSPCKIKIDPVGVEETSDKMHRKYSWSAISEFCRGKRGWMLMIDSAEAIYIPYSSEPEEFDRAKFEQFLSKNIPID